MYWGRTQVERSRSYRKKLEEASLSGRWFHAMPWQIGVAKKCRYHWMYVFGSGFQEHCKLWEYPLHAQKSLWIKLQVLQDFGSSCPINESLFNSFPAFFIFFPDALHPPSPGGFLMRSHPRHSQVSCRTASSNPSTMECSPPSDDQIPRHRQRSSSLEEAQSSHLTLAKQTSQGCLVVLWSS